MIRMPRLLSQDMSESARLFAVKLTLHRRLTGLSTAELIIPDNAPNVVLRDLIELYDANGSAGIYRVANISRDVGRTRVLTLEHALCTLQDGIIPAQGFMGTMADAFDLLLGYQPVPMWLAGDIETPADMTVIFATEYANLLDALTALIGLLPEGYILDFDQTSYPWRLHLRQLTSTDVCEGRLSRNLQTVRQQLDSSRLCTRVYPFGVELDTGYVNLSPLTNTDHLESAALDELGVISRTFQHDLIFDVPTLHDVAQAYLGRHAVPEAVITVHAADLSAMTGLALDAFRLGKLCRICLPDSGLTLMERIIAIDEPDVFSAPGQAVLTLSNRMKIQSEAAELDEIVRQVTTGKLIGGTVEKIALNNFAHGSYNSPVAHRFELNYAALLDARIEFSAASGARVRALLVDGVEIDYDVWRGGSFSLMPFLKHDELGQIAQGEHVVTMHPWAGSSSATCGVESTVTLTVIPATTT